MMYCRLTIFLFKFLHESDQLLHAFHRHGIVNAGAHTAYRVIIREDLLTDDVLPGTPTMMKYKVHADNESLYNTPPCYGIYICGKVFKWLLKNGGKQ